MIAGTHSCQELDTQSSYCSAQLGRSCEIRQIRLALGFHVRESFLVHQERIGAIIAHNFRLLMVRAHFHAARVPQDLLVKISQYSPECFIVRKIHQMIVLKLCLGCYC